MHAQATKTAAEYFSMLARSAELPITSEDFTERIKDFWAQLERHQSAMNALALAALRDKPCPQSIFAPWASSARIWQWRRAEKNPLPAVVLNGKVCIRPSDFFGALQEHGASRQIGERRTGVDSRPTA